MRIIFSNSVKDGGLSWGSTDKDGTGETDVEYTEVLKFKRLGDR